MEGGDPFFLKEGDAGGAAGLAARSAQSNHAFDDEYPERWAAGRLLPAQRVAQQPRMAMCWLGSVL